MSLQNRLATAVKTAFKKLYNAEIQQVEFQATRSDFKGDITIVVFPFLKVVRGNPVEIGNKLGAYLQENLPEIIDFEVVKGFLNLSLNDDYFLESFYKIYKTENFGLEKAPTSHKAVMVEYSSPNTNKPLHLGHIRNNLLGYSISEILKAAGKKVYKTQIINDRGIHICKSMLAWKKWGNGETPKSTGLKGDKLVGNYYVKFNQEYKKETLELAAEGMAEEETKRQAPLLLEAQKMLQKWESGDSDTVALWKKMNQWVYDGFEETYTALGVDFDKNYYESNTYLLGKDVVEKGLKKGIFFKKGDGSVWIDLTDEGLDEKIVLRADGTAVYMTQDIGTAIQRIKDYPNVNSLVYTVGNEQDYHFKVLFLILKKLGYSWAENLYHLSYGMVDLPSGKMKSREGTVVDADDLIAEMAKTAREISEELGKLDGYTEIEKEELYKIIGLGALKYHILKVDPKKRILFNPAESIDFQGNTGPFIQYTYARIQSILRRVDFNLQGFTYDKGLLVGLNSETAKLSSLKDKEKSVLKQLALFPETIKQAAKNYSPALIANYAYDLVKEYNSFYQSVPILGAEDEAEKIFRTQLSKKVAEVIKNACGLLGINVPKRM